MPPVKVREVAKKLSVSPSTVSRVLQGTYTNGAVSISTASRVLDYCNKKGYLSKEEKNQILMKMKLQSSQKKIFCLSCYDGNWTYTAIFSHLSGYLQDKGQFTSFFNVRSKDDLAHFPADQAGSIIVLGRLATETRQYLQNLPIPIVVGDYYIEGSGWNSVNSSNLESMTRAVEILVEKGHERIAFMCLHDDSPEQTYNLHQRQSGYIIGMLNAGLSFEGMIQTDSLSNIGGYKIGSYERVVSDEEKICGLSENLLKMNPMPTAVVAASDGIADIFRMTARKNGLRVPEDISVIGYDGLHHISDRVGFEPVSTMVVNYKAMARAMVDLASDLMIEPEQDSRHIIIPCEYEDMGTVAAASCEQAII
jgi:DNA-binding LacI/PurR family transcriptional regulator